MDGWHHWLNGRESEWTPGVGDGQGGLAAAIHGVAKSWTRLNYWTELNWRFCQIFLLSLYCINYEIPSYIFILLTVQHYFCCCCCSVTQLCLTLCNSMDCSTPGFPVLHYRPELTQPLVHWVDYAIQSSHPLSSPSLPALNLSWAC